MWKDDIGISNAQMRLGIERCLEVYGARARAGLMDGTPGRYWLATDIGLLHFEQEDPWQPHALLYPWRDVDGVEISMDLAAGQAGDITSTVKVAMQKPQLSVAGDSASVVNFARALQARGGKATRWTPPNAPTRP